MHSNLNSKSSIADNLRFQRRQKNWTQEQLSESSGVAVRTIQRIENAKVEPHFQTITLLADSLGLKVSELSSVPSKKDVKRHDAERKWLLMFHLSPIIGFIIPFSNLIIPILLWVYKRDEHPDYNSHGKAVINFHLTITLIFLIGVFLLLVLFELGFLIIILTSIYSLILILLNVRKVVQEKSFRYPLSVQFFNIQK